MRYGVQPIKPSYWNDIQKQLEMMFYSVIFKPLVKIVKANSSQTIKNAIRNALGEALASGKVQYAAGVFSGQFNAATSAQIMSFGAHWDAKSKVYRIDQSFVPGWVKAEASAYMKRAQDAHLAMKTVLDDVQSRIHKVVDDYPIMTMPTVEKINGDFQDVAKRLEVMPELTIEGLRNLAADYSNNFKLYIQNFSKKMIVNLRDRVEKNAEQGFRFDKLIPMIQSQYNVSRRKAKFLARQETGLFMSQFRRQRFSSAGVTHYRWSTSHDERVRPTSDSRGIARLNDHRDLDGKVFAYTQPPIVDRATGRRANPGEDFNCVPGDSRIDFVAGIEKGFRRWYSGELTTIITESNKTIRATPNHPVLTTLGWKPIGLINQSDEIIELVDQRFFSFELNGNKRVSIVAEIFEFLRKSGLGLSFPGETSQFHGDGSNGDVDVVWATRHLSDSWQPMNSQGRKKLSFTMTEALALGLSDFLKHISSLTFGYQFTPQMAGGGQGLSFFKTHTTHPQFVRFRGGANDNTGLQESATDNDSFKPCTLRNGKLTFPTKISFDDRFWIKLQTMLGVKKWPVIRIERMPFSGHVFNLQTLGGYYTINGVIVSNCRCVDIPILEAVIA